MAFTEPGWIRIATRADFRDLRKLVRHAEGIELLMVRLSSGIVAVENRCTHLGMPLDQGRVIAGHIHCPFHGACFELRTGAAVSGPAVSNLRHFPVKETDEAVFVRLLKADR